MLRNNNLLPAEYEDEERDRMIADTLRNMIDNGVQVSDDEARHAYNLANEKIGLRYVEFASDDFAAKISPTDAQIADYYKKYPEQFREPERIKLTLRALRAAGARGEVHAARQGSRGLLQAQRQHAVQASRRSSRAAHSDFGAAGASDKEKAAAKAKAEDVLKQAQAKGG